MAANRSRTDACQSIRRVSQATVLALTGNSLNDPVPDNPLNPAAQAHKTFFLRTIPLKHWEVLSFNPARREVCIALYRYDTFGNRTGDYKVITIILPEVAYNPAR